MNGGEIFKQAFFAAFIVTLVSYVIVHRSEYFLNLF